MTANPFESPSLDARELDYQLPAQCKRHPLLVLLIGLLAGGAIGGLAGATSSGALGCAMAISMQQSGDYYSDEPQILDFTTGGAFLGGFFGVIGGTPLGFLLCLVAAFLPYRLRLFVSLPAMTLSGMYGVVLGMLGGAFMAEAEGSGLIGVPIGALLGLVGGVLGGWLLSRSIGVFVWGWRPQAKRPVAKATAAP